MKPMKRRILPAISPVTTGLLLAATLAFAGCTGSPPSRFYLLTPRAAPGPEASSAPSTDQDGITLMVGPVEIARYLDRSEILLRTGPNEVHPAESGFWAEPLNEMVPRVLARDLGVLLHTDRVMLFPRSGTGTPPDFALRLRVDRFDTDREGRTLLEGEWTLTPKDGASSTTRFHIETQAQDPEDCASVTAAMNEALGTLGKELAAALSGK